MTTLLCSSETKKVVSCSKPKTGGPPNPQLCSSIFKVSQSGLKTASNDYFYTTASNETIELLHFSLKSCSSLTYFHSSQAFAGLRACLLQIISHTYNFKYNAYTSTLCTICNQQKKILWKRYLEWKTEFYTDIFSAVIILSKA